MRISRNKKRFYDYTSCDNILTKFHLFAYHEKYLDDEDAYKEKEKGQAMPKYTRLGDRTKNRDYYDSRRDNRDKSQNNTSEEHAALQKDVVTSFTLSCDALYDKIKGNNFLRSSRPIDKSNNLNTDWSNF